MPTDQIAAYAIILLATHSVIHIATGFAPIPSNSLGAAFMFAVEFVFAAAVHVTEVVCSHWQTLACAAALALLAGKEPTLRSACIHGSIVHRLAYAMLLVATAACLAELCHLNTKGALLIVAVCALTVALEFACIIAYMMHRFDVLSTEVSHMMHRQTMMDRRRHDNPAAM